MDGLCHLRQDAAQLGTGTAQADGRGKGAVARSVAASRSGFGRGDGVKENFNGKIALLALCAAICAAVVLDCGRRFLNPHANSFPFAWLGTV